VKKTSHAYLFLLGIAISAVVVIISIFVMPKEVLRYPGLVDSVTQTVTWIGALIGTSAGFVMYGRKYMWGSKRQPIAN
jgi:hypothetical protein